MEKANRAHAELECGLCMAHGAIARSAHSAISGTGSLCTVYHCKRCVRVCDGNGALLTPPSLFLHGTMLGGSLLAEIWPCNIGVYRQFSSFLSVHVCELPHATLPTLTSIISSLAPGDGGSQNENVDHSLLTTLSLDISKISPSISLHWGQRGHYPGSKF